MNCLDLQATYGAENRIIPEPGWGGTKGAPPVIPCRHGHIFAHSKSALAASTNRRGSIAKRLAKIGQVWQDASDGLTIIFDPADFGAVAAVMVPKRRRRLSPEHRAKLAAAAAKHHFRPGSNEPPAKRRDDAAA